MKTLKLLSTAVLLCVLYVAQAQNACFGTFLFNAEGSFTPNMRFTPQYALNPNWTVVYAQWQFGDGDTLNSFSNYILHNYTTGDSAVDVCLIVAATDTVNNITCVDTFCKNVEICTPNVNNGFLTTGINGNTVTFRSVVSLYQGGTYPILQTINYGDGSANVNSIYSSAFYYDYSHTYPGPGTYIVTASSSNSSFCRKDTSIIVNITGATCSSNASFTTSIVGSTVTFNNTSTASNGYTSLWTFYAPGVVGNVSTKNPTFSFAAFTGPYSARLIVTDSILGCKDTIVQQLNITPPMCMTFQPGAAGIDALITQLYPDSSFGWHPDYNASMWTYNGNLKEVRSLIKFDLSAIPTGATITSANLSLYAATNAMSSYPGQPTYGSNNASYLKKVTAPWGENTVTWNNQPSFTTTDQVFLQQAASDSQDYQLNIQQFAQQWVDNPAQNYGAVLDMISSSAYNALIFGSSDNTVPSLRPKLEICYVFNGCTVQAGFNSPNNAPNFTITNTSTPLSGISSYKVQSSYASSGVVHSSSTGNFGAVSNLMLPADTMMNVCLIAFDTAGTCSDTFCKNIFTGVCNISAGFTFNVSGSAVLTYNTSTFNHPTTYQWLAPGAWPSYSTATDTAFYFPQPGVYDICLIATNSAGCTDTSCVSITNIPTDTICGMVFNDANSNGLYDFGEQKRPNSTVSIDGNIFTTDTSGFYRAPVVSGMHVVSLIAPPGWSQTLPDTPLTYTITTASGDYVCGLDFGMHDDTLILSGIVYQDNNGNGLYDGGDSLLPNKAVVINGATVYTNSNGYYSRMVYSGTYTVGYTEPSGFVKTQPINPGTYTVTAYGSSITGLNFGIQSNSVTLTGTVFFDLNNNGVKDSGEPGVLGVSVRIGLFTFVQTNSLGNWSIVRPAGTYAVTYNVSGSYVNYTQTTPASISVPATTVGGTYANNDFGIYLAPGISDVCLTLSQITNVTPAMGLAKYQIKLTNYGTTAMSGVLEMNHDPLLTYHSANVTAASVDAPNYTVTWNVVVAVGQTVYIRPNFSAPNNAVPNTNVFNAVFYNPDAGFTDINMACNEDTLHQQVKTSYDPNDKYVSPIGQGNEHYIRNIGQRLDYTIMFQNTGNAPAVNVILLDTVEADLDIESFEMKDASHDYHVQIEGREITWIFSNIMLVDSFTDADSSIGFVSFHMNANTSLPEGTVVSNSAGIYFDYNEVVATGTAYNTIEIKTSIADIEKGVDLTLQPNPFTTYTNIVINGGTSSAPYILKVYDVTGREIQNTISAGNVIRVERNGMAEGVYMYEVRQDDKIIGKGKMVAQ